jgi:hypothetical protein
VVLSLGRKKKMKTLKIGLLTLCALMCFTGCGLREVAAKYRDVENYTATVSDTVTVSCDDRSYIVLNSKAEDKEVGKWIGRVDKLEGKVFVSSVNAGPEGKVLVMVNGEYYHAKPVDALEDDDDLLKVSVKYAYPTDAPEK